MIHKTRNQSNGTTERQKEKTTCFNAHFQYSQPEITGLNQMWSLSRTSLHAARYN